MTATWLDKTISWFAPELGLRRVRSRAAMDVVRFAYDGAKAGRRTGGWISSSADANTEVGSALVATRNRARDLVRNNPHARKAIGELVGNQIGTGIQPRANTGNPQLNVVIDSVFEEWSQQCDADGQLDFYGLQWQVVKSVPESGEVLVRFRSRRPEDGLKVPLQLQVLESDFLDSSRTWQTLANGGYIIQGIQFTPIGQREGYYLFGQHPGSVVALNPRGLISSLIPASDVLHVYLKDRPGQVRGMTWFAPVMLAMRDLADYEDAELVRKRVEACLAAFVIQPSGIDGPTIGPTEVNDEGKKIEHFEPGMVSYLKAGEDIKFNTPAFGGGYKDYRTAQLQAIASGLGVPYEVLSGDMGLVNYSSYRGGMLGFRNVIEAYRWLCLMPMYLLPVWRRFIDTAYVAGQIPERNYGVKWTAPKFESVDPLKDAEAEKTRLRCGTISLPEAIAEHGYDPDTLIGEIAESNAKLDQFEIILDSDPRNTTDRGQDQSGQSKPDGSAGFSRQRNAVKPNGILQ